MMRKVQTRAIVILLAVLLAVVAASGVVLFVLPESTPLPPAATSGTARGTDGSIFNVLVLQRGAYVSLDKRLLNEGALPVTAPAGAGKANPFL